NDALTAPVPSSCLCRVDWDGAPIAPVRRLSRDTSRPTNPRPVDSVPPRLTSNALPEGRPIQATNGKPLPSYPRTYGPALTKPVPIGRPGLPEVAAPVAQNAVWCWTTFCPVASRALATLPQPFPASSYLASKSAPQCRHVPQH